MHIYTHTHTHLAALCEACHRLVGTAFLYHRYTLYGETVIAVPVATHTYTHKDKHVKAHTHTHTHTQAYTCEHPQRCSGLLYSVCGAIIMCMCVCVCVCKSVCVCVSITLTCTAVLRGPQVLSVCQPDCPMETTGDQLPGSFPQVVTPPNNEYTCTHTHTHIRTPDGSLSRFTGLQCAFGPCPACPCLPACFLPLYSCSVLS